MLIGLGGNTKIVEVGGNPYLLPSVHREKIYDLKNVAKEIKSDPAFIIGPGAGPHPYIGKNCEVRLNIYNICMTTDFIESKTFFSNNII